jgi:hypothetical protein
MAGALVRDLRGIAKQGKNLTPLGVIGLIKEGSIKELGEAMLKEGSGTLSDSELKARCPEFAKSFLKGLVLGIEYVERNWNVIADAYQRIDHRWSNPEDVMREVRAAFARLDKKDREVIKSLPSPRILPRKDKQTEEGEESDVLVASSNPESFDPERFNAAARSTAARVNPDGGGRTSTGIETGLDDSDDVVKPLLAEESDQNS